eukprot:COSAG02_NODE_1053_length_14943_cov_3.871076_4_plen_95_part_00
MCVCVCVCVCRHPALLLCVCLCLCCSTTVLIQQQCHVLFVFSCGVKYSWWVRACVSWRAVWAALIGVLFLKGKMNLKQVIGIAMSFGGVVLVSG